uniref:Uncharacterized protein n=1 Tax=Arundo donax TaxID=35708 RepID=A0A0A9CLV6_ARUDO
MSARYIYITAITKKKNFKHDTKIRPAETY